MVYDPFSPAKDLRRKLHPKGKNKAKRKENQRWLLKIDLPPPRKFAICPNYDFSPYKQDWASSKNKKIKNKNI